MSGPVGTRAGASPADTVAVAGAASADSAGAPGPAPADAADVTGTASADSADTTGPATADPGGTAGVATAEDDGGGRGSGVTGVTGAAGVQGFARRAYGPPPDGTAGALTAATAPGRAEDLAGRVRPLPGRDAVDRVRGIRATELPGGEGPVTAQPAPEPVWLPDTAVPLEAVPRLITSHGCWYPSADPGGRNAAFICDRAGVPQLWAGPVDAATVHLLDSEPHPVTEVAWSPDGRWIAYTTAPGGGEHTRVLCVRPDGTGRRILAGGEPGSSAHLGCWTRDGTGLAVTVAEAPVPAVPQPPAATEPGAVSGRTDDGGPPFAGPSASPAGSFAPHPEGWTHRDGRATLLGVPLRAAPPVPGPVTGGSRTTSGAEPSPRTLSAYLVDPDGSAAPVLLASEREAATLRVCDLSRDGRLALLRRGPRGRREALVVRLRDQRVTCSMPVADGDPWIGGFSPDGRTLWLRSDHGREFAALYAVRLGPRGARYGQSVAARRAGAGLELLALDHNGRAAVLAWNMRGVTELEVAALLPAGRAARVPAAPHPTGSSAARPETTTRAPAAAEPTVPAPTTPEPTVPASSIPEPAVPAPTTLEPTAAPEPVATASAGPEPTAPESPTLDSAGPAVVASRAVPLPHEVVTRVAATADADAPVVALSGSQRRPGVWWLPQGAALRTPWSSRDEDVAPGTHPPVRPVPLRPTARDGLALGGWYYRAPGRSPGAPAPCVVHLHGGPEEQERPVFEPLFHELLGRGLDVFAPDVRGSSGYGRSFVDADLGRGRFAAIDDVADCVAHAVLQGLADPRRLAVMGHSYGGYLTLASLVWHPDLFRTGVAVCGMSDFATFFAGTEPWIAQSAAHKYGHPERDRELLRELSPMSRIDELRVPVLAVHGEHDTNVPPGESEQFVRAARERGVEAAMLVLRDEGHYFRRADNRRTFRRAVADWVQRHLGG
ncbi:alpha/beta fold hydrolase [Streptomyces anandii]|uniref:alpha/beta fold hydrolase n=1 Tax=Streptomyces anandii TaxID=285454 RepID=UPI0036838579